jgi:acyl carrier protein phosphodiesterase
MNFLAHLYLSGPSETLLIGNFIADFVRGKQHEEYPKPIQTGILLHRSIDTFADQHEAGKRSALRLRPHYGKYAPVLVDIFYDHFLAKNWHRYHAQPLPDYATWVYSILKKHIADLPPLVQQIVPRMAEQDWLSNYATLWGIEKSLEGISRRATFENNMDKALVQLEAEMELFQSDFDQFFPDMQAHVSKKIEELG